MPSFIEDLRTYQLEHANGLVDPLPFCIANFLIGLPYLFLISVIFSIIAYWLSNFYPSGTAFFRWVMWLFLDLIAAESLVVLVSSIFPIVSIPLAPFPRAPQTSTFLRLVPVLPFLSFPSPAIR